MPATATKTQSRSAAMIANAIRGGYADDQAYCARIAESMSGGVSSGVVGADQVIVARLLKIASDATGRSMPDLLFSVDPGKVVTGFGREFDPINAGLDSSSASTVTDVPRR